MKLRTQKAWATYDDEGSFSDAVTPAVYRADYKPGTQGEVPVLVVPEAAVNGCKHENHEKLDKYPAGQHLRWCCDCGAFRQSDSERWQRPRILRAGRQR